VKTACFFHYFGPGRISIARYAPRHMRDFRTYKRLAPAQDMLKMDYKRYKVRYQAILEPLDPQQVWDDLHALVAPHEPVLLCWEHPPLTGENWCHRTMVAQWFQHELGHQVTEVERRAGS